MSEKLTADGYEPSIDEHGKIVNGVPYIALSTAQALADALEACRAERDALRNELASQMKTRTSQPDFATFVELKHGIVGTILTALQDGRISRGKAAEALAEVAHGVTPRLPDDMPAPVSEDVVPSDLLRERDEARDKILEVEDALGNAGVWHNVECEAQTYGEAIEILASERDEWRDAAGRQTAQVVALQTECDEIRVERDMLRAECERCLDGGQKIQAELDAANARNANQRKANARMQSEYNTLNAKYETARQNMIRDVTAARAQKDEFRAEWETTMAFYEDECKQLDAMRARAEAAEQREVRLRQQIAAVRATLNSGGFTVNELRAALADVPAPAAEPQPAPATLDTALREPLGALSHEHCWCVDRDTANARIAELWRWIDGEPQRTRRAVAAALGGESEC